MKHDKPGATSQLRDFNADYRMILLSGLSVILGGAGAVLAWILLRLIYACTNLFYFQRLSWQFESAVAESFALASGLRADRRRTHRRRDGALWIGKDSRSRHSGGAGVDSREWREDQPSCRDLQAAGFGGGDRHGRPVRRGRPHHHDSRIGGLAFRAIFPSVGCGAFDAAGGRSCGGHGGRVFNAAGGDIAGRGIAAF